ncbi:MAG: hypothetical protein LBU18_03400 [Treponema sp.]|jgi:hypothetical protein|nr:hypothetical protein [Treponema sp.]
MAFQKTVFIAVCVSLGAGFFSFFLFRPSTGGALYGEYGVLSLDQLYPDRAAGEALTLAGVESYFSESSQWVYLDDFGELAKVPLDEYAERLEPFDPRNDGYAERLRSFFVRDGTRRFFIPLDPGKGESRKKLAARLDAALGDTPYTLDFLARRQPFPWFLALFALFAAAAAASLFLSAAPLPHLAIVPLCAPLAFLGSSGLALTGALFAFSACMVPLFQELFAQGRGGNSMSAGMGRLKVSGFSSLTLLVFACVYAAIVLTGNIPFPAALSVILMACCVTGTVLWAESKRGGHTRFRPAPIRKAAADLSAFFRYFRLNCSRSILPWIPAAALALALPFVQSGESIKPDAALRIENIPKINALDYETHLAFQLFFSLRPLKDTDSLKNRPESLPYSEYYRYAIGDDGLVIKAGLQNAADFAQSGGYGEFPPFPLADLINFLEGYTPPVNSVGALKDLTIIAFILIPALPSLIWIGRRERGRRNSPAFNDKRIAA